MDVWTRLAGVVALVFGLGASPALAEVPLVEGGLATVGPRGVEGDYPVLTRGQVVFVNAQRLVVTQEPLPIARSAEAPPDPPHGERERPAAPRANSTWVAGHWTHGVTGFVWVAGRYIAQRRGHVFVPPRWAVLDDTYFYFTGFYVPYGVYVRSYFNRYYFSGTPEGVSRSDRGPYWPIGAPSRANSALTSAGVRDPYWPIGLRR